MAVFAAVDGGGVLFFFDLVVFGELFFFGADAFEEGAGGFVGGILGYELALDGFLEDGFFQLVREGGVEGFQLFFSSS